MCKMPKGIADFKILRERNFIYIDKTSYIETLENSSNSYIHFLRPRRFGKTLFTSMLQYYYDVKEYAHFENLFKGTYIGKHPTKERNSYYILRFDFSGLDTANTKAEFHERVYKSCIAFVNHYELDLEVEKGLSPSGCVNSFLVSIYQKIKSNVYVIVDEYDHFANEMLSFAFHEYSDAVSKNGFVRKFYEVLKTHTVNSVIGRIFITGVSPITLDSITSGFNISTNLTLDSQFNEMCGFTTNEMKYLISQVDDIKNADEVLFEMKRIYDGYKFSEDAEHHVFNPNMSLYYLDHIQQKKKAPRDLVDPNIYSDYKKIENLLNIRPDSLQRDALTKIMKDERIACKLTTSFELSTKFSRDDFISLLYYLGYLTISEANRDEIILTVPNEVIRTVYFNYFNAMLEKDYNIDLSIYSRIVAQILDDHQNTLLVKQMERSLHELDNRDFKNFDEKYIKLIAMSIVGMSNYIRIESEKTANGGYVDLVFYPYQTEGVTALIELKYIKKESLSEAVIQEKRKEAIEELQRYSQAREFQKIKVVKWILIFSKDTCVWNEAIQ